MEINEVQDLLNTIAEDLFPDLMLKFSSPAFIQTVTMWSSINAMSSIYVGVDEVVQDNIFNTAKAKTILKKRTHEALLQLRDHVQNSLDKLEGE